MECDAADHARRALEGHARLCDRFERRDEMLRRDGRVHPPGAVAHLWPFARAFVAALDVAGMPSALRPGFDAEAVIARRLHALERYWDERGPAYASDPPRGPGARWGGGDIYYDDNAWAGLALVQLERLRPGRSRIDRLVALADFARAGWSHDRQLPAPGGVYWVQQGRGRGARNHDRNLVSTAPNAELMLHLAELQAPSRTPTGPPPDPPITHPEDGRDPDDSGDAPNRDPTPTAMAAWVDDALGGDGGIYRDKLRGDGTIDPAPWSYNQGSMIGLHALLAGLGGSAAAEHRRRAARIAIAALDHFESSGYAGEPVEFVAILIRNLLVLSARTDDEPLRTRIAATVRTRAAATWPIPGTATLLAHSAAVTLQALAAWDPVDHGLIT